jgi:hypothetical protein
VNAARGGTAEHGPHPVSWFIGSVLVGWVVVYNLLRISGQSPSEAAWVSLVVGGGLGALCFGAVVLASRRLVAAGRVVRHSPADIPAPAGMSEAQRRWTRLVAPPLGVLAAVALVLGVALAVDWFTAPAGDRAVTVLVLAAWNLLVAFWIGDEALRLHRHEADGIESVALGAALTAVLAGVGLTRGYFPAGQVVLIVIAGVAGAAAALLVWRLRESRTPPIAAPLVLIVAALSLILTYAT